MREASVTRRSDTIRSARALAIGLFGWLVVGSMPEPADALDPGDDLERLTYQAWSVENGLPQETVHAMAQTPDGYLWLGTHGGLVRTDGLRFVVFDRQRSELLGAAWINDLLVDRDGVLWIAANDGLFSYSDEHFERWDDRFGLPGARVLKLALGRRGIWFSTYGGDLAHWDGERVESFTPAEHGAPPGAAWELAEIAGELWIGTWSHGLWRYRDGRFEALDLLPGSHGAWAVEADGRAGLWVGTDDGLFHLTEDGEVVRLGVENGLSRSFIQALRRDQDGNLWIGTNGGGLHRLTFDGRRPIEARIQRIERNRGALGRQIWELFEDREGHLWVGTFGGGLERFGEATITTVGPGDGAYRQVNAVLAEPDGCVWLATHTDGVWHQCDDQPTTVLTEADGLPTAGAWTVARDRGGSLWIGTARGLATLRDGELRTIGTEQGLPNAVVLALHPALAGGVWVGTNGGLARVDGDVVEVVDPDRLPSPLIRGIDEEGDGTLWVGTSGAGLVRLAASGSGDDDRVFGTADGLPGMLVWSLLRDRQGILWIGSSGGLSRFVDGALRTLDSRRGLTPDSISSILEDPSGGFWLATPAGIVHLERQERDAYFLDDAPSVVIEHYGSAEGMGSTEFLGGVQPSSARSADGRLWFPSLAGAAVLDPKILRGPDTRVVPIIEELRVDGAIRPTRDPDRTLAPGVRRIELRYTAPSTHAAYRLHFRHRLIGFDEAWIEPTHQRSATFTNLSPGDYRFEVSARHESGAWSDPTTLRFTVEPRFYQTPAFLAVGLGAVLLTTAAVFRLRTRALRRRQERLEREVEEAVARLKVLRGLLPICASCKKVRDDGGYWSQIEQYISSHSEAEFSHGMCPDCASRYLQEADFGATAIQKVILGDRDVDEPPN